MNLIVKIILGVVAAIVLLGIVVYATDYGVEAKITDKGSDDKGNWVQATTAIGGLKIKQYLDTDSFTGAMSFSIVHAGDDGNFIVYNIRTGHLRVWTNENSYRDGNNPFYDNA